MAKRHSYFDLNREFTVVDVETTGQSAKSGYVIEIGMVKVKNREIAGSYSTLIKPPVSLPFFITQLTGIRDADLYDAPVFAAVKDAVRDFIRGSVMVAHNAAFDYGFIKKEYERHGEHFFSDRLCTVRLGRKLYSGNKKYNLDAMISLLNVEVTNRHRALGDALATAEIFVHYLNHPEAQDVFSKMASEFEIRKLWLERLEPLIEDLPHETGVYIFADEQDLPLYIGKSTDIRTRVLSHIREDNLTKKKRLLHHTHHFNYHVCKTELESLILESRLIKQCQPSYNVQQRNWRQYVFLHVSDDEYPAITLSNEKDGCRGRTYGPYRSRIFVEHYLQKIQKLYKLCPELMKKNNRPKSFCFSYHLKQCSGACGGAVSPEKYSDTVLEAIGLLNDLVCVDSKEHIDLFLKEPELKEPRFYYVREGLKSLKQNQKRYPETFNPRYLIINPEEETGYLIQNGLLKKIFYGEELSDTDRIREECDFTDTTEPDDKESLDERLIIEKYVHMNRNKLKIINLK